MRRYGIVLLVIIAILITTPAYAIGVGSLGVRPSYYDLGRIAAGSAYSMEVTVVNGGDEARDIVAEVQGRGAEWVSLSPDNFTLAPGGEGVVGINLDAPVDALPDAYDLSIIFRGNPAGGGEMEAVPAPHARLRFIIPGLRIASLKALDTEKPNPVDITVIIANFYDNTVLAKVCVEILDEEDTVVATFYDEGYVASYPGDFYGTFKFSWDTQGADWGDYVARATATASPGMAIAEEDFTVGWMKGEILGIAANDVIQGETVNLIATVSNIGNLPLPTSVKLVVMSKDSRIILDEERVLEISSLTTEAINFYWDTGFPQKAPPGDYSAFFDIDYGHDNYQAVVDFSVKTPWYILFILIVVPIAVALLLIASLILLRRRAQNRKRVNLKKAI